MFIIQGFHSNYKFGEHTSSNTISPEYRGGDSGGDSGDDSGDCQLVSVTSSGDQPSPGLLPPLPERGVLSATHLPSPHGPRQEHTQCEFPSFPPLLLETVPNTPFHHLMSA